MDEGEKVTDDYSNNMNDNVVRFLLHRIPSKFSYDWSFGVVEYVIWETIFAHVPIASYYV